MNVDLEIIEKELSNISERIRLCFKVEVLFELFFAFDSLNDLYKHLTGKDYKEPDHPFIKQAAYDEYADDLNSLINREILYKYESEKEFIGTIVSAYLERFENCDEEPVPKTKFSRVYSAIEAKALILDFFSKYDKRIYDAVKSIFNNRQIQTGMNIDEGFSESREELEYFLDEYSNLNPDDFTVKSFKIFEHLLSIIIKKTESENEISGKKCERYVELLNAYYERLVPVSKNYRKKTIEYDYTGDTAAKVVSLLSLKKSYVMVESKSFDIETIINIVHELGHTIEESLFKYTNPYADYSDTNYLCEVSSFLFEYEFLKYLIDNGIEIDMVEYYLFSYYLDIVDDFIALNETMNFKPIRIVDNGQFLYSNEDYNEEFVIDIANRVGYGYSRYLAILLSRKHSKNEEEFYNMYSKFMINREHYSSQELLESIGITDEELYDIPVSDTEINRLIKRFNS